MSLPTVLFLGPAVVCALSWLGLGSLVPPRLLPQDPLLRELTRIAIGAIVFGLATYGLGRAGWYRPWLLVALTGACALLALPSLWRARRVRIRLDSRRERVAAILVGAALALDLVAGSTPVTSADALKYHVALPHFWLQSGMISDAFWNWVTFDPFGIDMLFGQGLAMGGGPTASAVGAVLAVLAAAAAYGLGRELGLGSRFAGLAAAALFVLQGVFTWSATSTFVELGLSFYVALAAWYALRFFRGGEGADLAWTGAMAGAAAGTKYVGLQAWLLIVPVVLVRLRPRHLRALALALGLAAAAGGPWYLKNALVTGNPIYPLAGGGKLWTPDSQAALDSLGRFYGMHASLPRLLILPVDLLVHGDAFDRGRYVGTAIFGAGLLALLLCRRRETILFLASAVLFTISWWYLSQQARFLMPLLAVVAAVGGQAVGALWRWRRVGVAAAGIATVVVAVDWAAPSAALTRQALPVAFGATSRAAYIDRETGTYRALLAAGRRSSGTLGLVGYPFPFYVPRRAIALDEPAFAPDVSRSVFLARLRADRVRYVLADGDTVVQLPQLGRCVSSVATYHARFVTSRSLGTSRPIPLRLYRLRRPCL